MGKKGTIRRNIGAVIAALFISILLSQGVFAAEKGIAEKCGYDNTSKENPSYQVVNCLLTEAALEANIPPEVVKGIATQENGDWKHFDGSGNAIISTDGGIGIMQITNDNHPDKERLKNDLVFNIEEGIKILDAKFKREDLPKINDHERDEIESWYFAVMAYNGTVPQNSPIVQATGERNQNAYQEEVFQYIEEQSWEIDGEILLDLKHDELSFNKSDFTYDPNEKTPIIFNKKNYKIEGNITKTKHQFKKDMIVSVTDDVNFRRQPYTGSESLKGKLDKDELLIITGPFTYDLKNDANQFVWYPVIYINADGKEVNGYVASSYLREVHEFADFGFNDTGFKEINALYQLGIISGYPGNKIGLEQTLKREEAAALLNRALKIESKPYNLPFTDVDKDEWYINDVAAVYEAGIFDGYGKTFGVGDKLTRGQMAKVLVRAYDLELKSEEPIKFTDIEDSIFKDEIKILAQNGITQGANEKGTLYKPKSEISRWEFSVLLYRTLQIVEKE